MKNCGADLVGSLWLAVARGSQNGNILLVFDPQGGYIIWRRDIGIMGYFPHVYVTAVTLEMTGWQRLS